MDKEVKLRAVIREAGSVLVTLSGGVDSALLCLVAYQELGPKAKAFTAVGASLPERELEDCRRIASEIGMEHLVLRSKEMEDPNYVANPANRCFFCKSELYTIALKEAVGQGLGRVVAGINQDDLGDHRPGIDAAKKYDVLMPYVQAGMGKADIRALAAKLGLSVAKKPAAACLASRLPYGTAVTDERLRKVERAENFLKDLGFQECRVRYHDNMARIEVPAGRIAELVAHKDEITGAFKAIGFIYVTLDLAGFRSGSMNEVLPAKLNVISTV